MIIYRDIISDDEVLSDSFKAETIEDVVYKVKTAKILDEDDPDAGEFVNLVKIHDLREVQYDKKTYGMQVKGYMAKVVAHLEKSKPDRVAVFKKNAQEFIVKTVMANFSEFQFFSGKEMNPEGMVLLSRWEEGDVSPTFYVWKDGVNAEKV